MYNILMFLGFAVFLLLALGITIYSLRSYKSKKIKVLIVLSLVFGSILSYKLFGGYDSFRNHQQSVIAKEKAQKILGSVKNIDELISKIKKRLDINPDSKGWYLLGRLYMSTGDFLKADQAFLKAYKLNPHDEKILFNLAYNRWQLNNERFDSFERSLLKVILENNPNNPDALSLLALDASNRKDCKIASGYWDLLLKQVPASSDAARAIHQRMSSCV